MSSELVWDCYQSLMLLAQRTRVTSNVPTGSEGIDGNKMAAQWLNKI
jgi:hypothetical protein